MKQQPAPPHVVFEAVVDPERPGARPWLFLLDDEQRPTVVESSEHDRVVWSSLWTRRPDALVRFDLARSTSGGTELRWTLAVAEPAPDAALTGHLCKRLNQLINAELRYSFGN